MDSMPESNSNHPTNTRQPEAHSTNITVPYATLPYVRCIPVWRALLQGLAVGPRSGKRLATKKPTYNLFCHDVTSSTRSQNPKVFPKRNDNRHNWQQEKCARSPEVRKRSLRVKRIDTHGHFLSNVPQTL